MNTVVESRELKQGCEDSRAFSERSNSEDSVSVQTSNDQRFFIIS